MASSLLQDAMPPPSPDAPDAAVTRFRPYECTKHIVTRGRYVTSNDPRGHIPVYEYPLNGQWLMVDSDNGYVLWTGIWKALGHTKADIAKILGSHPELAPRLRRVRGGYLKIQGTWMPYEIALRLARRVAWPIRDDLVPLFGPTFPSTCLAPDQPGYGQLAETSKKRKPRRTMHAAKRHEHEHPQPGPGRSAAQTSAQGLLGSSSAGSVMSTAFRSQSHNQNQNPQLQVQQGVHVLQGSVPYPVHGRHPVMPPGGAYMYPNTHPYPHPPLYPQPQPQPRQHPYSHPYPHSHPQPQPQLQLQPHPHSNPYPHSHPLPYPYSQPYSYSYPHPGPPMMLPPPVPDRDGPRQDTHQHYQRYSPYQLPQHTHAHKHEQEQPQANSIQLPPLSTLTPSVQLTGRPTTAPHDTSRLAPPGFPKNTPASAPAPAPKTNPRPSPCTLPPISSLDAPPPHAGTELSPDESTAVLRRLARDDAGVVDAYAAEPTDADADVGPRTSGREREREVEVGLGLLGAGLWAGRPQELQRRRSFSAPPFEAGTTGERASHPTRPPSADMQIDTPNSSNPTHPSGGCDRSSISVHIRTGPNFHEPYPQNGGYGYSYGGGGQGYGPGPGYGYSQPPHPNPHPNPHPPQHQSQLQPQQQPPQHTDPPSPLSATRAYHATHYPLPYPAFGPGFTSSSFIFPPKSPSPVASIPHASWAHIPAQRGSGARGGNATQILPRP